jgi:hypothetical protein
MYGDAKISSFYSLNNIFRPSISEYTFMGGVNYRVYMREKLAVGVTGLVGVGLGEFQGNIAPLKSQQIGMWPSESRPSFSAGVNVDYNFFPNFAVRVTPTYLGTTWGNTLQNNLGVNVGVIYRFGRIKVK